MCPMCWPPGATTTCSPRTGGAICSPRSRRGSGAGSRPATAHPARGILLGSGADPERLCARVGALAARPPVPLRSDRDRLLHLRRIPAHHAHRTRSRRRIAVAGRGVLPAGQETRPAWSSNRGVPTVHGTHTTLSMLAHIASTARREISRSSPNTDHTCHPGCERLSEATRHTRSDDHPRPHNPFHTTEFTTTTSTNRCIRAW